MFAKRQISEKEKQVVISEHGRKCFVDGAPISGEEQIEFHHIRPFSEGGPTTPNNIAPVCKIHHRKIGKMSLQEFRDKIELERFFRDDRPKYLDDVIRHKSGGAEPDLKYEIEVHGSINIFHSDSSHSYPLYTCPATDWEYFYATLPVKYLHNDAELQPRPLRYDNLWKLYRHFLTNTQLAPSICRLDEGGRLLLFDGQHKAAAQIWAGRPVIECKVYIEPDERKLKETNLDAHGPYRQMTFYSHELMTKYADIFGEDWKEYFGETTGEKSELGFFNFLVHAKGKTVPQARNEILNAIYKDIIDNPENKLSQFLSEKSRARKQPLTFARTKKSFFQNMLFPPPAEDEYESESDHREDEKQNLVRLMSIISEEGLEDRWSPQRDDQAHRRASRIFSAGAVRAWVVLLKNVINVHLKHYTDEQRQHFFYRSVSNDDFKYFRDFVKKIFSHKIWDDPDPSGEIGARLAKDDATTARDLFEEKGLTVEWVLGS